MEPKLLKTFVLPALWLFVLPVLAIAFSVYTTARIDADFLEGMTRMVAEDATLTPEQRAGMLELPGLTTLCLDAAWSEANTWAVDACSDAWQLVWLGRLGWISVGLGLLTGAVAGGCAAAAWVRAESQVLAFRVGWNAMRLASATQIVLQGVILVGLSFWLTAWFLEIYYVKLILIALVLVALAAWGVLTAIFARTDLCLPVEGTPITPEDAPALWERVRQLADRVGTAPPDRIVGGIDDNFYVTQGTIELDGVRYTGRSLYVSLSLLRVLEQDEADAVLAHELAHFHGGDTAVSASLVPMQARYRNYLIALHEGVVTLPIFHSMLAFYQLFELAQAKNSRDRELLADRKAAAQTSAESVGRALIRINAYAGYRSRVEQTLFEADRTHASIGIAGRVATGFVSYVHGETLAEDIGTTEIPHPFDTHPALIERLAAVGAQIDLAQAAVLLEHAPSQPWTGLIPQADAIEGALWDAYEARFAEAHAIALAWRYLPATPEERAHVEQFFPARTFTSKLGRIEVTFERVEVEQWPDPIAFDDLQNVTFEEGNFSTSLRLQVRFKGALDIPVRGIEGGHEELGGTIALYLQRHRVAREGTE